MTYFAAKTFSIEKALKTQIENAERIFKLYDVDNFEKFVNLSTKALKLENEEYKAAIDKMMKEATTDMKQRELLKFSIGFLKEVNPAKREEVLSEFLPVNKDLILSYLKKLDSIKN